MDGSHALSIAFGIGAALLVALIGPLYAAPALIVAFPLVFLTLSRTLTRSTIQPDVPRLLGAFAVAWLLLLPVAPVVQGSTEVGARTAWAWWVALGGVPLLFAIALVVRDRLAKP